MSKPSAAKDADTDKASGRSRGQPTAKKVANTPTVTAAKKPRQCRRPW